jgi:abortive infection bacteriophage resistance protein
MGRSATTLDEQLILLRSRGMILDLSEEKTKEILADIGYYRLGYYWIIMHLLGKHLST